MPLSAVFIPQALAADPVPFPSTTVVQVFVAAQTVTTGGAMANYFAPGSTVVFRAYAVDQKTKKVITANSVKYFYVTIPNQPNVKLKYNPSAPGATATMPWVGTWTVPSTYPAGIVGFKVLVKTTQKTKGQFVQMPVATSQLTDLADTAARGLHRACRGNDCPARDPGRVDLRGQRQRHQAGRRGSQADRVHADERLQAR